jgi:hypothetical protein
MRARAVILAFGLCLGLAAQTRLTVEQLVSFIRSSIQLKQDDRQVASYLRRQTLVQKLDDRTIEELQGEGAGPRTVEALRELRDASRGLPSPPPPVQKAAPVPIPPPSPAEQRRVIEQAREYALGYTKNLPDFICTQVTRRYVDPSGLEFWQQEDVITARLTYFEQREEYKVVLVNNRVTEVSMDSLGGATSSGEFGSMLRELFAAETETEFQWERWATLRGRRAHVFSYQVAQSRSHWHVNYQKRIEIVPAYRGLVYVDRDTLSVLRITFDALLPPSFPLQQASSALDYDFADISGGLYMLPLKAVVRMREGKVLLKNEVEFRLYRKFTAEATITFETPEPLPEEKTKEQPAKPEAEDKSQKSKGKRQKPEGKNGG